MTATRPVRVAAAQYAVGSNIDDNLCSTLRVMDSAITCSPQLLVLPEFVNHLSWYDSLEHCYEVSLELNGEFLRKVARKSREMGAYVVVNCTLRRDGGVCTGTSLLYSPRGELLGSNDKQVLIGHENSFLRPAMEQGPIVETPFGKLGLYACMDGVICETPRSLALRGAQILCNSVNSFAPDEASLHIPVRAAENKVFVVAANKIGPLVPAELIDELSVATNIPQQFLSGAGESQIVAPDGTVLAIASSEREEVVFADINPLLANNKNRLDGTDVFMSRRPELYTAIASDPATQAEQPETNCEAVTAAIIQLNGTGTAAINEALKYIEQVATTTDARLIALPELFCFENKQDLREESCEQAQKIIAQIAAVCGDAYVASSFPILDDGNIFHAALLINAAGIQLRQYQLHADESHAWATSGQQVEVLELPFARVGLVCGSDAIYPETFRLLAIQGADTVIVCFAAQEPWELKTGLLERAGENHINLLVATQPSEAGTSFAASLHKDFTMLTPWESREFDGKLTYPPTTWANQTAGITLATLTPKWAANKVVSVGTDLVRGRAWHLAAPIVATEVNKGRA